MQARSPFSESTGRMQLIEDGRSRWTVTRAGAQSFQTHADGGTMIIPIWHLVTLSCRRRSDCTRCIPTSLRRLVTLVGVVLLTGGCSAAGFRGYGPKGDKFIGSAFGYQESLIAENVYFVTYTDNDLPSATAKFHRRARELCAAASQPSYDVSANLGAVPGGTSTSVSSTALGIPLSHSSGTMPMQHGYVTCRAGGQFSTTTASTPSGA